MVLSTQTQFAGPDGAMFRHFPGFLPDVVQAAFEQLLPFPVTVQDPAATNPTFCTKPANPVKREHVPA
jgi:hypothetical protein